MWTTFLVLLMLLLGLMAFYFWFGYTQIHEVTRPDKLVGMAETMLNDNLPVARQQIEEQVTTSAPTWARAEWLRPTARRRPSWSCCSGSTIRR